MKVIKIYTVEQIKDGGALPLFQKFVKADDFLQLQTENKELIEVIKETRKYMDRLPAEWFSEQAAGRLDDKIGD